MRIFSPPYKYPKTGFWVTFVLLNFILFLPIYLMYTDDASFLPSASLRGFDVSGFLGMLASRRNMDFFRISGDFVLLTALLFAVRDLKWIRRIIFPLTVVAYCFLFLYHIYYIVSLKLYGAHPSFLNDWVLAIEVLPIYLGQISLGSTQNYLIGALGGILVFAILIWMHRVMFTSIRQSWPGYKWFWWAGSMAVVLTIFMLANKGSDQPEDYHGLHWITGKVHKSTSIADAEKFESLPFIEVYENYMTKPLAKKPDIYCLFVESYGQVVYSNEVINKPYLSHIRNVENTLKQKGWHSSTTLSESPIIGGRSWLAFTSAFTGIRVENQLNFNTLQEVWCDYPHMVRYFNSQGYQTHRLKTMAHTQNSTPLNYYLSDRFYEFDYWTKYRTIGYKGYVGDWYGGIPDQYAINFWFEEMVPNRDRPIFFFFITMDSHGPWFATGPVVDDWRSLNTTTTPPVPLADTLKKNKFKALTQGLNEDRYTDCIKYEMDFITDFILRNGDENSIFLVIGDHQPALLSDRWKNTFNTPFHVISKDSSFVTSFQDYGFVEGMEVNKPASHRAMKHEGFYSLILRQLLTHYGTEGVEVPKYLPNGI